MLRACALVFPPHHTTPHTHTPHYIRTHGHTGTRTHTHTHTRSTRLRLNKRTNGVVCIVVVKTPIGLLDPDTIEKEINGKNKNKKQKQKQKTKLKGNLVI